MKSTSLTTNHHTFLIPEHFQNEVIPCLPQLITRIPEEKTSETDINFYPSLQKDVD